jgi:hypothetical protein
MQREAFPRPAVVLQEAIARSSGQGTEAVDVTALDIKMPSKWDDNDERAFTFKVTKKGFQDPSGGHSDTDYGKVVFTKDNKLEIWRTGRGAGKVLTISTTPDKVDGLVDNLGSNKAAVAALAKGHLDAFYESRGPVREAIMAKAPQPLADLLQDLRAGTLAPTQVQRSVMTLYNFADQLNVAALRQAGALLEEGATLRAAQVLEQTLAVLAGVPEGGGVREAKVQVDTSGPHDKITSLDNLDVQVVGGQVGFYDDTGLVAAWKVKKDGDGYAFSGKVVGAMTWANRALQDKSLEVARKAWFASLKKQESADFKPGQKVHLGFGTKGGAGFDGVLVKIEDGTAFIKNDEGRTFQGPVAKLSLRESFASTSTPGAWWWDGGEWRFAESRSHHHDLAGEIRNTGRVAWSALEGKPFAPPTEAQLREVGVRPDTTRPTSSAIARAYRGEDGRAVAPRVAAGRTCNYPPHRVLAEAHRVLPGTGTYAAFVEAVGMAGRHLSESSWRLLDQDGLRELLGGAP